MNKSNLFKLAHLLTKATVKTGDNYQVTLGQSLKLLNRVMPKQAMTEKQSAWLNQIINRIIIAVTDKVRAINDKKTVCEMAGVDTTKLVAALNFAITTTVAKIIKVKMQQHFDAAKKYGNDVYGRIYADYLDDAYKAKLK